MKKADFEKAMEDWASQHGVSAGGRDFMSALIVMYEKLLVEGANKNCGFHPESINGIHIVKNTVSLNKKTSAKQIKNEVSNLRMALGGLSSATRWYLADVMNRPEYARLSRIELLHLLEAACSVIEGRDFKTGRPSAENRIPFIKYLSAGFASNVGQQPASTPGGCFYDLICIALELRGIEAEPDKYIQQAIREMKAEDSFVVKNEFPEE